eukprot:326144-Hanusia_phi.AAC.1
MILTGCHAISLHDANPAHPKDTPSVSQSSPERDVQEDLLTHCHEISTQQCKPSTSKRHTKRQPIVP